jgi:hypothetical protein
LPSEQSGIEYKNENRTLQISPIKNKTRVRIPYEYKVGDQVLLETPGILRKLSTPRTGPYAVTNVYKNGTIRIQKQQKELYHVTNLYKNGTIRIQIGKKRNRIRKIEYP